MHYAVDVSHKEVQQMKRIGSLLLLGTLTLTLMSFQAFAESKVFLDLKDPVGDDTGNGKYVYPTDPSFEGGGMADIVGFKLEADETNVTIKAEFKNLVDPWKVGNRLTYLAIAIDNAEGGANELEYGANAKLQNPAEFVIYAAGNEIKIRDMRGDSATTIKKIEGKKIQATNFGDCDSNVMTIVVPVAAIGAPKSGWKLAIAVGIQEDYGAGGLGDFREVLTESQQWRGGGGEDSTIDSNIYDLIVPEGVDQGAILKDYSLDEGKYVMLPAITIP